MNRICYLLDENVASLYRAELVRREPAMIVWKVGDPGLPSKGTPDPIILSWCEAHDFIGYQHKTGHYAAYIAREAVPRH